MGLALSGPYLIDTNVLIYATLSGDPRHAMALEVLEARLTGASKACISTQNLAEMYPNLTGPKTQPSDSPAVAREKIRAIGSLPRLEVLSVTRGIVETTLRLCAERGIVRQRYFDAQIVATMLENHVQTIVTENDRDFEGFEFLRVVNPFAKISE